MLFVGAIPKPCIQQALHVVDVKHLAEVFTCCSGSFRWEQVLSREVPHARVHANDVSLLSTAIGRLLAGEPLAFRFTGRLEALEAVAGTSDPVRRLAALGVAVQMGQYASSNDFSRSRFDHYVANADHYVTASAARFAKYLENVRIASFFAGDFRAHARRAAEVGGFVFAWPPTYKSGYERFFKLVNEHTEWEQPDYGVWDPRDLPGWLDELDQARVAYCVYADHELEGRRAAAKYTSGQKRTVHLYASDPKNSAFGRDALKITPFRYEPVDAAALTADTVVTIARAETGHMNWLKEQYLARGIVHVSGHQNFLVYLDGKLAGGFIYARSKFDPMRTIYLLSDFSIRREGRLAKLIAMLATSIEAVRCSERVAVTRFEGLATTVFTDKPVSMKYRGAWKLTKRGDGYLQYESPPRGPAQSVYQEWFAKWGSPPQSRSGPSKSSSAT